MEVAGDARNSRLRDRLALVTRVLGAVTARRALMLQALRFGIVGVGNTATCLVLIWLLNERFGQPVWLASAAGYTVATAQSFLLNRAWTFAEADRRQAGRQVTAFVAVNIVCGLVFTGLNSVLATQLPLAAASAVTLVVVVALSFVLNRWLVFR